MAKSKSIGRTAGSKARLASASAKPLPKKGRRQPVAQDKAPLADFAGLGTWRKLFAVSYPGPVHPGDRVNVLSAASGIKAVTVGMILDITPYATTFIPTREPRQ